MRHTTRRRTAFFASAFIAATLLAASQASAQTFQTQIVAPDGTQLATDVYLPFGLRTWPVILMRTPYDKSKDPHDTCLAFAALGYACVAQDVRGRFASGGINTVFRDDGADGHATLDWINRQAWCNGKIGTFGASALGITQYALAPDAPSSLKCMVPVVATPDFYHHAAFQGGALRNALVYNWLNGQNALSFYDLLKQHRLWDDWWQQAAALPNVARVNIPAFHAGGWYDIFLQGTLDAYSAFQHRAGPGAVGRQKLLIGPWTHTGFGQLQAGELRYPANAAVPDVLAMFVKWYDYWLQGRHNEVETWPPVRVYLMGPVGEFGAPGNVWVDLQDWPPDTATASYYLTVTGGLAGAPAASSELELKVDPAAPVPTLGGQELFPDLMVDGRPMGFGSYDQRGLEARSDVLTFTSTVLLSPVTVMGRVKAKLWIRPDTMDVDVTVKLTDVYPDGRSMLVSDSVQRARMRCGDDRECFLVPGTPTEIDVELWATAIVFAAGHRIRIDVAGSNAPRFEVNPNTGGNLNASTGTVVARPVLLVGRTFPSRVDLPVLDQARAPRRHLGRR